MIALLETKTEELTGAQRLRRRLRGERGVILAEENVMGMRILRVTVGLPRNARPRVVAMSLEAALDALDRGYVRKICFKDGFAHKDAVLSGHFSEQDSKLLWKAKAAEVAERASPSGISALVLSDCMERQTEDAVRRLCGKFRHVALLSNESTTPFCRRVCEETGVSIVERPAESVILRADTAVIFDVPRPITLGGGCIAIADGRMPEGIEGAGSYVGKSEFIYCGDLKEKLPEGYCAEQILSAAMECGRCSGDDIMLGDISICENCVKKNEKPPQA